MLFTAWSVPTKIKNKPFHISCWSVCGPVSQTCCQFVVLISMFSAALTDGETLRWFPSKGVINRTWEAAASALTPCWGCLLGPRSRGQCLPFTPRYSRSLPWPFPAGKHAPHETASQSVPLFHPAPPLTTLPVCLILFFLCPVIDSFAEWYRCHRPHHCPPLYQSALFTFRWFLLWITPAETDVTLKRVSVSFRPEEEGERSLKVLSFMSLIDRRLSELNFFWPVITKIRTGLNASSLGEWKWSSPGERKTDPLARLRGLSLMLLAWHGDSPWLGHLFRHTLSHLALGGWETIAFSLHGGMMPGHQKTSIF